MTPPTPRERAIVELWRWRRRFSDRAWRLAGPSRAGDRFARAVLREPMDDTPITNLLYDRLGDDVVRAAEGGLQEWQRARLDAAAPADRRRLLLAFAAHERIEPVLERTGLRAEMPPENVHAMAHEPIASGGSYYYGDLVADCLGRAGAPLSADHTVLDFGCSSGRVVRVLQAAYPHLRWHGCDPNADATAWAAGNLPGIEFAPSPEYPPLPYADGQFDVVYAISIWSHFSEPAALQWADEMHRIVKPRGHWLVTTQGVQAVAHAAATHSRWNSQLVEILRDLYEHGFWFGPEFGERGDHGVLNPDWGFAFLTPEWLLAKLTPQWHVASMHPGRSEGSQDVYVLQRA